MKLEWFEGRNGSGQPVVRFSRKSDWLTIRGLLLSPCRAEMFDPSPGLLPWRVFDGTGVLLAEYYCEEEAWEFSHAITFGEASEGMEEGFRLWVTLQRVGCDDVMFVNGVPYRKARRA